MSRLSSIIWFFATLVVISVVSWIAASQNLHTRFYFWEFEIDLAIAAAFGAVLFFRKRGEWGIAFDDLGLRRWRAGLNIFAFVLPLFFVSAVIGPGILAKTTTYEGVDNPFTLLLATLFDVPAIYFFSTITVFLEEMTFRGFLFPLLMKERGTIISALISSSIWALVTIPHSLVGGDGGLGLIAIESVFTFSVGLVCCALFSTTRSIWPGYSVRIGILALLPSLLGGSRSPQDTFFLSDSFFFSSHGLLFSSLSILFAFALHKKHLRLPNTEKTR